MTTVAVTNGIVSDALSVGQWLTDCGASWVSGLNPDGCHPEDKNGWLNTSRMWSSPTIFVAAVAGVKEASDYNRARSAGSRGYGHLGYLDGTGACFSPQILTQSKALVFEFMSFEPYLLKPRRSSPTEVVRRYV